MIDSVENPHKAFSWKVRLFINAVLVLMFASLFTYMTAKVDEFPFDYTRYLAENAGTTGWQFFALILLCCAMVMGWCGIFVYVCVAKILRVKNARVLSLVHLDVTLWMLGISSILYIALLIITS